MPVVPDLRSLIHLCPRSEYPVDPLSVLDLSPVAGLSTNRQHLFLCCFPDIVLQVPSVKGAMWGTDYNGLVRTIVHSMWQHRTNIMWWCFTRWYKHCLLSSGLAHSSCNNSLEYTQAFSWNSVYPHLTLFCSDRYKPGNSLDAAERQGFNIII